MKSDISKDKMRKHESSDKPLQNEKSLIKILQKKLDERDAEVNYSFFWKIFL